MTMDDDPGHFNPTPPRKSYNPFECDDETFDTPSMGSEKLYSKEDQVGFDLKEFEESASPLTFLMDNDDSLWEESIASANDHTSSCEKDVKECELPEPIVSKDIGVYEEAHSHESKDSSNSQDQSRKCHDSLDSDKVSHELSLYPNEDPCMNELNQDVQSGTNVFVEDDSKKITDRKLDLEDQASFPVDWATVETSTGGLVYDNLPVVGMDPSNNASKHGDPDSVDHKDRVEHEDKLVKKDNDNSPNKEESNLVQELETRDTQGQTKVNLDKSQNEEQNLRDSDNSITFDSNSTTNSDPIKQEDNPQSAETEKPQTTPQTTTRHEKQTSSNSVSTGVPIHHLPSSITFSGPVAYSGNVSIRSESSTGSTGSFAFPVLQNEWNSSPVRMAKADRRRGKKHQGWMQSLICCRF